VLYTHAPDKKTPIAEQAAAFNDSYEKGKFSYLGVANLDAEMLKEWISVADSKGFVKPSVYQGK
jgi:aflatoxin B1 aldehyde reductase